MVLMVIVEEVVSVEVFDVVIAVVQALDPSMLSAMDLLHQVTEIQAFDNLVN